MRGRAGSKWIAWLATAAVAGRILQWIWFDWRLGELEYKQTRQLRNLETQIARLNSDTLTDDPRTVQPSTSEITLSEHSLNNALDDLDSGNLITRTGCKYLGKID